MGARDAAEALEAAKAECVRLERIIQEALDFDGKQTVNGVTDNGWMNPDEWFMDQVFGILEKYKEAR